MRLARTGLTVGTRLIARDTVAVDTLASRAISRSVSPSPIVIATVSDYFATEWYTSSYSFAGLIEPKIHASTRNGRDNSKSIRQPGPESADGGRRPIAH